MYGTTSITATFVSEVFDVETLSDLCLAPPSTALRLARPHAFRSEPCELGRQLAAADGGEGAAVEFRSRRYLVQLGR